MKSRTKKRIFKIAAAALACAAAAGIFLQTTAVSVQAATNSMPGIDIIVNGNSIEKPFRILELTDSSENAEIGYYVSGQEPFVKLYTYTAADGNVIHFSTLEEGLSQLPEKERKEFAMNVKLKDDGRIDEEASTGILAAERKKTSEEEAPLSYNAYQEKYFLDNSDSEADWNKVDLKDSEGNSRTDAVQVNGSYVENQNNTGDYTKEEQQYYPIRKDVTEDKSQQGLFRENIENFSFMEDEEQRSAYFLEFAEISNAEVNKAFSSDPDEAKSAQEKIQAEYDYQNGRYGYYENVYTDLTEDIVKGIKAGKYSFPGEKPDESAVEGDDSNAVLIRDNSNVVDEADSTKVTDPDHIKDEQKAGTQEDPYIYLGDNIEQYPYYQYTLVGDLQYVTDSVKDMTDPDYRPEAGDIVMDDGQYWYLIQDPDHPDQLFQTELSIVTGRQPVAYEDIAEIPEDFNYNYYYVVKKVWFCSQLSSGGAAADPTAYQFFGWYYPSYPNEEDMYLPVSDNEIPTYYISEAQYTLTPGTGDYDFVPGGGKVQMVQVDHLYYQGGYENHDWLKKYVFHLEKDEYDGFNVQVDTRYADNMSKPVHANVSEDQEEEEDIDVSSYDLIYVNGHLSDDTAASIASAGIPCIINMSNAENEALKAAFSSSIQADDADGNYVTKKVYVLTKDTASDAGLVNNGFASVFDASQSKGFEEITQYIEQENRYRELGEEGSKLDPLSKDLSQARAVEYIINYRYKRNADLKDEINVLQIMPDVNCEEINEEDIYEWLYAVKETVTACCEDKKQDKLAAYMTDGDKSTAWFSKRPDNSTQNDIDKMWKEAHPGETDPMHYIKVTFDLPATVKGLVYTPNTKGYGGGSLKEYKIVLYDQNGSIIETITGDTGCTQDRSSLFAEKNINFDHSVSNVSEMKIYFVSAYDSAGKKFNNIYTNCAELKILKEAGASMGTKVNLTTMTASEFVGHIDDIASIYDMIYISGKNPDSKKRNKLITGNDPFRYVHIGEGELLGDGVQEDTLNQQYSTLKSKQEWFVRLLGQLDTEYVLNADGTRKTDEEGHYYLAPLASYANKQSGGYFRGSGNDMTPQQCEELLDFVKSGYPVVTGTELVSTDAGSRKVNETTVDNASYYYEFLNNALNYGNFCTAKELNTGTKDLSFFANLAKPVINFQEKPKEPPRSGESVGEDLDYIKGELKYQFTINNDSDAEPAKTTYDCKLYLDLNFDGNLSEKEEQSKYIVIEDSKGNVMTQTTDGDRSFYELAEGETYTLTRKIPEDYYKLITWKLEITSNRNSYVHTSQTGYAKQKNESGQKQVIKVLQILPSTEIKPSAKGTWNLKNDSTFKSMIQNIEDFDIQIDQIWATDINNKDGKYNTKEKLAERLQDVQMVIMGFDDDYPDISNKYGQVEAILDYVKKGKSIIFTHDTTSYMNYDFYNMHKTMAVKDASEYDNEEKNALPHIFYNQGLIDAGKGTWGYSLNQLLRAFVGMDRYSVTSQDTIGESGTTVSALLKKGEGLTDREKVSFEELQKLAGDIAYTTGGNRQTSYAQVQAYTNNLISVKRISLGISADLTTTASKVNDGAITQYPYRMGDTISIAKTHWQWNQLAMEQDKDINGRSDGKSDVVVWYCLADNTLYNQSPNDVRNNYYFYSRGNVIYTGVGHSSVSNEEEIKLFINAMVAAANVTAVDPEVNFVEELNPTADIEKTRYYSTDQSAWTDGETNVLEKTMDFYVNVKDYNMVSADLNQKDVEKQEMTLQFYIDSENGEEIQDAPVDTRLADITKNIGTLTDYNGDTINVSDDGLFHLKENNAFKLTVPEPEQYLRTAGSATSGEGNGYRKDCRLYVKVTSTVYLYGEPKTSTKWAGIDLKQRQLFELN